MPKTEELVPGSPEERRKARDKGLYYLQFSDKTESEMRKKLAEQGFSPASVEDAVNFLLEYRYLNDENYALRYLEKNGKKKSRRQIAFELKNKGIPAELVESAMEEIPVDEEAQILALLEKKKYSGEAASREERQKISGFLARKGFSYEAISAALIHYARKETE
jgi:regulatory protein